MARSRLAAIGAVLVALVACAKDMVLPDLDAGVTCGDGIVQPGEQCDVQSQGCSNCMIAPGYACSNNVCTPICGDGVTGDGGACTSRDTACDMTGYWAARETNYTADNLIGAVQTSSTWMLFHFVQTGADFHVVEHLECGTHSTGSGAITDFTADALRADLYLNRMDGVEEGDSGVTRPARHGTSQAESGGCAFAFDRWYRIRGALESYLPTDFSTKPALSTLPPLPTVMSYGPTSTEWPAGATDPDGDGIPGLAYLVGGVVMGVRNAAGREWKDFATHADAPVPAYALKFVVPDGYDDQESVLRTTQCGTGCGLVATSSHVPADLRGSLTLLFIGKTFGSSRVAPVVVSVPRQNADQDLMTCANVRALLPHDPSVPPPSDAGLSKD
jgi:cysteine-rich repeat protein